MEEGEGGEKNEEERLLSPGGCRGRKEEEEEDQRDEGRRYRSREGRLKVSCCMAGARYGKV